MAITPILFPYTSVSSDLRNVALQFFPSLTLIQPMESALGGDADSDSGADIIVHVPAKDRQPELESLIKAYHLWAQQHPSTDLSAWAGRKEAVPFFDETAVARIQSQIRRGDLKQAASDPLFDCRLFLGIAQEFDRQMAELARSLETFRKAEVRMMRELKGEMETAPAKAGEFSPANHIAGLHDPQTPQGLGRSLPQSPAARWHFHHQWSGCYRPHHDYWGTRTDSSNWYLGPTQIPEHPDTTT